VFAGVRFSSVFRVANTYEHWRTSANSAQVGEHLGEHSRRWCYLAKALVSEPDPSPGVLKKVILFEGNDHS